MDTKDFGILRSTFLFDGLNESVLRDIIGNQQPRTFTKGQIVFQQGDEADHFYIILEGWVKLYRQMPSGEEIILHIFSNGESFAEAAIFNEHLYPASAEVVANARLLAVNSNLFIKILEENPKIAIQMLCSISARMKHLVAEIEQIKGRNAVQRVAYFLFKMCPHDTSSTTFDLPYEKNLIASRLGIKPESLSRIFNRLRQYDVNCLKNQIIISDINALRKIAHQQD